MSHQPCFHNYGDAQQLSTILWQMTGVPFEPRGVRYLLEAHGVAGVPGYPAGAPWRVYAVRVDNKIAFTLPHEWRDRHGMPLALLFHDACFDRARCQQLFAHHADVARAWVANTNPEAR